MLEKLTKQGHIGLALMLVLGMTSCHSAEGQNIAKGKGYTFSEQPNYTNTLGSDELDLTDGIKKNGQRFWQDESTVGWSNKKEIQIDLDLGSTYELEGFSINTARNSAAEVEFPVNCLVFTSLDNEEFSYLGDVMFSSDNTSGPYKVEAFELRRDVVKGRYVKFVLATKSKFIFLDEIEVFGNEMAGGVIPFKRYDTGRLVNKTELGAFINEALEQSTEIRSQYMRVQSDQDFLEGVVPQSSSVKIAGKSAKDLNRIREELFESRKEAQKNMLPRGIVFTPIKNISSLQTFSLSEVVAYAKGSSTSKQNSGTSPFYFFSLINNDSGRQSLDFRFTGMANYGLYEVLPIASLNNKNIKDALVPVVNNSIQIEEGENKLFVVTNKDREGKGGSLQIVSASDNKKVVGSVSFDKTEGQLSDDVGKLHANVWAYLDKPVIKGNKKVVVNDLDRVGVDVVVVHSGFIDGIETKDFSKLKGYLNCFHNLQDKKILLFYNLKSNAEKKFKGKEFLDKTWKGNFDKWYRLMQEELSRIGVNTEEIYFYPYDEIKVGEVDNFIKLVKWGKEAIPNFKTFVTIIDEKSYEAGSYADIAQVSIFNVKSAEKIKNDDIWVYSVLDHARERSPYKDYRLMSWIAYYYDLKGVGFWNYSALPSINEAKYNRTVNGNIDYSVVYLDEDGKLLSSLRWEYFSRGLEDYKILKDQEKKVGKERLKKMVKSVIDSPDNSMLADELLRKLN